jgi:ribosomal protein S18 acetylase RimI-like enzyme
MTVVSVKQASCDDIQTIVDIHIRAFPGFFTTQLGSRFLFVYYSAVLNYSGGKIYLASAKGRVVGFVGGFMAASEFYRFYKNQYKFKVLWALLMKMITDLSLVPRICRSLISGGQKPIAESKIAGFVELSSIAALPDSQNLRVGQRLLEEFIASYLHDGAVGIYLSTDTLDNDQVNGFYLKNCFQKCNEICVFPARQMNVLVRKL